MREFIAVDTGGTFTDCVIILEDGRVVHDKAPSTPEDPSQGVMASIANAAKRLDLTVEELLARASVFAHGSTVGLNALCTRNGARTGLLTTRGHEDAILIGRVQQKVAGLGEKEMTYAVRLDKAQPLVPKERIKGISERVDYKGAIIVQLNEAEVEQAADQLVAQGVEAVAICFLWSFMNKSHEQRAKAIIRQKYPQLFVSASSELAPLINEYERTSTTTINTYLGPKVSQYVNALGDKLSGGGLAAPFLVMQSMGGVVPAAEAAFQAVNILSSGPVGGVMGTAFLGKALGLANIIATDVGGTSFDVGLVVNGQPMEAKAPVFEQYRVLSPMVDVVSIGAGGGSIAWVEPNSGLLQVGPQSAGAYPGPACYGRGGTELTVTDADLLLGRINPDYFFTGRIRLDRSRSEEAASRLAGQLGMDGIQVAKGVVDIVDAHMADLVRKVTIERGYDPRDFAIFAYGGGGPTHVGAYGRDVGVKQAVISPFAPVFSAFGIAGADIVRFYGRSSPMLLPFNLVTVNEIFVELEAQARQDLEMRGVQGAEVRIARFVEMKYRRQTHEVKVAVPMGQLDAAAIEGVVDQFETEYERIYGKGTGYRAAGIELTNFRVTSTYIIPKPELESLATADYPVDRAYKGTRPVFFSTGFIDATVWDADLLRPQHGIEGPAIIESMATTVVVHPGQKVTVDSFGNLLLQFQ